MPRMTPEGFWAALVKQPTGCWVWTGCCEGHGYGATGYHGRVWKSHRLAFTLACGPIPPGMYICHRCDNPPCCNPDHLFLGTPKDNTRDAVNKGRWIRPAHPRINFLVHPPQGEKNTKAKVTADQVRAIRRRYADGGISQQALADEYGMAQKNISAIVLRQHWAHVK